MTLPAGGRILPTSRPSRCGACRREIRLLEWSGHLLVIEPDPNSYTPHRCDPDAILAWTTRDRIERIKSRVARSTPPDHARTAHQSGRYDVSHPPED
jgi:hypothetical protein